MNPRALLILATSLLAGCASQSVRQAQPVVAAPIVSTVGLQTVLGQTAAAITASFGAPDLDIREGTARKLQFLSAACVLDVYLYPPANGREAVATHIDARMPDGRDIDRASCVAATGQRRQAR